ncbi:hypothetical protein SGLAM104S_02187 [Streptomyces glaucescens]
MDPNNRGPEDHGHDGAGQAPRQRPPREPLTPDFGQHAPALARTVQLVSGEYLLTVNPVDGSEIELCPPVERPGRPRKPTAAERAGSDRVARPPAPPGPTLPELPLVGREEERERLVRLLARGRSVRVTGPGGSGRTRLLDTVAEDCADLAPDGVIRLSGFHRTAAELLQELFHAVHEASRHRPERDELLEAVREIGAVVVLDDIEFGGAALDELLDATPECAFLISATPDVPAPSAESALEEVFLGGLDRAGGLELLRHAVGRALTEDEASWPATCGSSPRACRCASSRPAPSSGSATGSGPARTPSTSSASSRNHPPTSRSTRPSPTRYRCPPSPRAPRPSPCCLPVSDRRAPPCGSPSPPSSSPVPSFSVQGGDIQLRACRPGRPRGWTHCRPPSPGSDGVPRGDGRCARPA